MLRTSPEEKQIKKDILLYHNGAPLCYKYSSLVWEKDEDGKFITKNNLKGDAINYSFSRKFTSQYPQAKKVQDNSIVFNSVNFLADNLKPYQPIQNGIETLDIDMKQIIDKDDVYSFKIMEEIFSLDDKLKNRLESNKKLITAKIICGFGMETGRIIYLNLSILEYAIYINADAILEYLKNENKHLLFRLEDTAFISIYASNSDHPLREDIVPSWNQKTLNYTPLDVAIELKKTDATHLLLQKIEYNILRINQRVIEALTQWLEDKVLSDNKTALINQLLSKRKSEVDTFFKASNNRKDLPLLFKFYITLAEYWHQKPLNENSYVSTEEILSSLSQAKLIFEKMNTQELKEIDSVKVQKLGMIKSQLYRDAADNESFDFINLDKKEDDLTNKAVAMKSINIKIIEIQLKANIAALALNANDQILLSITQKIATNYYNLIGGTPANNDHKMNFFNYRALQLKKFLNNFSFAFNKDKDIPCIKDYLNHHIYLDEVFNVVDDYHKRNIHHWMAITNQLEEFHIMKPCQGDFLFDRRGYTPLGLLMRDHGLQKAIELIQKYKFPLTKENLLLHKNGRTILHKVCKIKNENDIEKIESVLKIFENHHIDINIPDVDQLSPFDIFMQSAIQIQSNNTFEPVNKIYSMINWFVNKGANLSQHPDLSDLWNKSIQSNWFLLTEYLIKKEWVIEVDQFSFAHLLQNKMYVLIVDLLEVFSKQKQGVTTDLCLIKIEQDDFKILLRRAKLNNKMDAFVHVVAYFQASLTLLENERSVENLISFYHSLDDEVKTDFITNTVNDKFKQILLEIEKVNTNHINEIEVAYSPCEIMDNSICTFGYELIDNEEPSHMNIKSNFQSSLWHYPEQKPSDQGKRKRENILNFEEEVMPDFSLSAGGIDHKSEVTIKRKKLENQPMYKNILLSPILLFNNASPIIDEFDDNLLKINTNTNNLIS